MTTANSPNVVSATNPLLRVEDLRVEYTRGRRLPPLRASDGVTFEVGRRETVGLVGESGSGKSTIGRAILGLAPVQGGQITFAGEDITYAGAKKRRALSADLQVVFQDPYSSLNPTRTVGQTLAETLRVHERISRQEADCRVRKMLERVGMPSDAAMRYPGSFSGGQRQRIAIARALMAGPELVICDEAVSALDVSVQANVLNLLRELQDDLGLSYVFIAHDLDVVRHLSHRIVVLYRGRIVEQGAAASVCAEPTHPYTRALLEAVPVPEPGEQRTRRLGRRSRTVGAAAATSIAPSDSACPFVSRCPHAVEMCSVQRPPLERTPRGTDVACHRWQELSREVPATSVTATH